MQRDIMENNTPTGTNQPSSKFKKLITSRKGDLIFLTLLSTLALLFTLIFYSVNFTEFEGFNTGRSELNFWTADAFYIDSGRILNFNIYMTVALVCAGALYAVAELVLYVKNRNRLFYVASIYNIGLSLICLILGIALKFMDGVAMACCVVSVFFGMMTLGYLIARRHAIAPTEASASGTAVVNPENTATLTPKQKKYKFGLFICEVVELLILVTVLFIPLYSDTATGTTYVLVSSIITNNYPIYISIAFVVMVVAIFGEILYFISTVSDYFGSSVYVIRSRRFVLSATIFTLLFFLIGYSLTFYFNLSDNSKPDSMAFTVSYIPFILAVATMIIYSVFCGKLHVGIKGTHDRPNKPFKIEPLIAVLLITVVTFVSLAINVIEISVKIEYTEYKKDIAFTGYELLSTYKDLESGFQLLAFVEFAVLLSSGIFLIASLITFLAKDANHYKVIKAAAVANFLFVMMIGLFGIYFKIGQKINVENIESVLRYYELSLPDGYKYEVDSQTIYMLIASAGVIIYMLIRKIFSLGSTPLPADAFDNLLADGAHAPAADRPQTAPAAAQEKPIAYDFDACPAFTELDQKQPEFNAALEERRKHLFTNLSLPNLVRFLVDYARECRIHLSYTPEDIATFVAGLGASRLAILQGMSGTGKTSLPKMFTEAIMGNCEIVEVESSWRDKNELLGYYNEFSKCFTPKKFTQCLYKARLNSSVLTFIVLDEMNLSRIEYYFSDFLSLMENEEDKREIKLLNVKLYRTENGERHTYDGLTDGHTVKIPANVWFIGTANRDESTFEISDKVYDRAQTMNFNKRAPKITSFSEPLEQRFMSYDMLLKLFDEAKKNYVFDAEGNTLIQKAERLLAPYNISFGNRILRQIEDFVKIYCACFGDKAAVESDAVEKILLSKVVRKLESKVVENKEKLATEFEKIGLTQCSEFIRRLNED